MALNAAASAALATSTALALSQGRVAAAELNDDIRLKTVIHHAASDPLLDGQRCTNVLRLKRRDRRPLLVAIGVCGVVDGGDRGVLVQIVDPDDDLTRHVDMACEIHGIAGAEARLARLLVAGHSLLDAAVQLRVQPDTARSYLKQMFIKTGVNRQAALVRLLLASMVREAPGNKLRLV